ncbi:TRAFAC clade GTPase domain-containing protein [Streptomyces arboris]|uniref:TRAFAC clade GTPase domain-containing protein n=1 Tax=Streptomyces arboris TaxID=2600619 RepID=UPI003C2BFE9B
MSGLITAAVWLTAAVWAGVCLFRAFWEFLFLALGASAKVLGPRTPGTPDPRIAPVGTEPAQRAYWSQLMWVDAYTSTRAAASAVRHRLLGRWMAVTARRMFTGRQPSTGYRFDHWIARFVVRLLAPGTALGAITGALLASAVLVLVHLVMWLLVGLVWLSAVAGVTVLRGGDRARALVRRVRMKCPYPGCYRAFPLAVHRCPGCGRAHRELRPGRFGALWHVCSCGRRLTTVSLAGRDRLAVECPHCDRSLPAGIGRLRIVHVPVIGGTSSGKTMLMAAAVSGLHATAGRSALKVTFATDDDRRDVVDLNGQLKQDGWVRKTQGGQPRALMLRVTHRRRHRLVYLYDPMGESLYDVDSTRRQEYLAHADGVVLVVDVLAEPQVRRSLTAAEEGLARAANPSEPGPWQTYQTFTGELSALAGGRRRGRLPLAVVVTKRDVLDRIDRLRVPATGIGPWLATIGLDPLVRDLGHRFRTRRYWALSAYAATGTGPLVSEQQRAAEAVLWILARTGLRVGKLLSEGSSGGPGAAQAAPSVPGPRDAPVQDRSTR